MISCVIVFDVPVNKVDYEGTHQWLLGSCVKFSQTAADVEKLISKLRQSCRSGKIDLSCISVWNATGLYYCQQIVACSSSKRFV